MKKIIATILYVAMSTTATYALDNPNFSFVDGGVFKEGLVVIDLSEKGLVSFNNKVLFKEFPFGGVINFVGYSDLGFGKYFAICQDDCLHYFLYQDKIISLDLESTGFISGAYDLGDYLVFSSNIPDSREWIVTLYSKKTEKILGSRYLDSININSVSLEGSSFIARGGSDIILNLSSFTSFSLENDRLHLVDKIQQEGEKTKSKRELLKILLYIIFTLLFMWIAFQIKKRKSNIGL